MDRYTHRYVSFFECEKITVVKNFEEINETILKPYEHELEMEEDESDIFEKRRNYLQKNVVLNINDVKSKLLSIRKNADDFEQKIEDTNNGENIIEEKHLWKRRCKQL